MRGRWAAAVSLLAVLVTGCASTIAGSGVRGVTVGAATGAVSQSAGVPASGGPQSEPPASGGRSPVRPMPPVPAGGAAGPVASSPLTAPLITSSPTPTASEAGPTAPPTTAPTTAPPKTPAGPTSPSAEFDGAATVETSAFPGAVTDVGFASPSGNITCGIQSGTVVCQIDTFDYTPPKHDCGPSGWGFNFRLRPTGSAFLFCAGDVESGGPRLDYGQQIRVGDVRCVSRKDGVTCQNTASGNGFRLARAAYTFFGPAGTSTVGTSGTAHAAVAIPAPLVGEWGGHGRELTISSTGAGNLTYRTYQWCGDDPTPPCDKTVDNQIEPGGHIQFALAPAGTQTATGTITQSNDPKTPVGTPVTATVSGYNLELSFWPDTPFCAANTPSDKWNCGA